MNYEQKNPDAPETKELRTKKNAAYYLLFETGIEFAVLLALPLLAFIYAGKWLDAKTNHHFFVIIGILAALALSAYMIYRKISDLKNFLK